jgi:ketosteroid isomerase-like protein
MANTLKNALLILILILNLAYLSAAQTKSAAGNAKPDAKSQFLEVFDRLIDGIKTSDADKVMSAYEKSPRIQFFNNNGSITIGWDQMAENRRSLYSKTKNVNVEISSLKIEILSSTSAYLTCRWKQTQEFDGKPESASGRMTLIFKRIGKEWKIVHVHTSPDQPAANRPVFPSEQQTPSQNETTKPQPDIKKPAR